MVIYTLFKGTWMLINLCQLFDRGYLTLLQENRMPHDPKRGMGH